MGRFRTGLRAAARRFGVSESGFSAVEFAFVGGPFLLFLGCMFETGVMLFTEYTLQAAVQKASRAIRTGNAQDTKTSPTVFKNSICANGVARFLMDCSKVTVYVAPADTFAALKTSTPNSLDIGLKADDSGVKNSSFSCGDKSKPMAIIATYDYNFAFPFMDKVLGNFTLNTKDDDNKPISINYRRLRGISVFRNEPFATSNSCSAS